MRKGSLRLWLVTAVIAPIGAMGALAAPAVAAGTTCSGDSGAIKLAPGVSETAQVQNITIKGTLSGCTGSTVTGGKYVAHLKTTAAVTCAALKSAGEPTTGTIVIKWSPKGQGNSHGTFTMPLAAEGAVNIGGTLEEPGLFAKSTISGTVSQSYGACGGAGKGKMKPKKLKKGTFTGSAVVIEEPPAA
jgi:hypothetical protein